MYCDLHFHSVYSDGLYTPAELAEKLCRKSITYAALCDHETINGYPEMKAACDRLGIFLLPGIELNTGEGGATHLLCYGQGVLSAEMRHFLEERKGQRLARMKQMLRLLRENGLPLSAEKEEELLNLQMPSRPHVARALVEAGYCGSVQQAFDRYLSPGHCAFIPHITETTAEAVRRASALGCVTVLAHPMKKGLEGCALSALTESLKREGLMGMEVFHPSANVRQTRTLQTLALRQGLLITGGSDFHGDPGKNVELGSFPGQWTNESEDIRCLIRASGL